MSFDDASPSEFHYNNKREQPIWGPPSFPLYNNNIKKKKEEACVTHVNINQSHFLPLGAHQKIINSTTTIRKYLCQTGPIGRPHYPLNLYKSMEWL